jgi:uncharacterized protein (TIGR03382 family)
MKKHLLVTLLGLAVFASKSAAVIAISLSGNPSTGPQFVVGPGTTTPVLDGRLIRIGTFETAPAAGATFDDFASSFQEFGRTTIGHTTAAAPVDQGRVNRSGVTGNTDPVQSPQPDTYFLGRTVYIWVYDSATESSSVAQGLFSTTQATFADALGATSTSVNQYYTAYGRFEGGTATSTTINTTTDPDQVTFFHLAVPIPEPATASLGLLALAGLMRRRR